MPTAVIPDHVKVKIRHHLGYLNVAAAATFALGTPAAVETQFIIEGAMQRLLEEALPELERLLAICDQAEEQMVCNLELLAVNQVGEITINPDEQRKLTRAYDYWVDALANLFGIQRNPFDKRLQRGGLNVPVMR